MDSFPDRLPILGDFQIGYLGTKRWIESPEDLRMITNGQHESFEDPPNFPLFKPIIIFGASF